jgi:hypothetical protein
MQQTEKDKLKRLERKIPSLFVFSTADDTPYRNARYRMTQFKKREPEKYDALLSQAAKIVDSFDQESKGILKRADETLRKFYQSNRAAAHVYVTATIFYVAFLTVVVVRVVQLAA